MRRIEIPLIHEAHIYDTLVECEMDPLVRRVAEAMRHATVDRDKMIIEITDGEAKAAARWIASYSMIGKFCLYFAPDDEPEPPDTLGARI